MARWCEWCLYLAFAYNLSEWWQVIYIYVLLLNTFETMSSLLAEYINCLSWPSSTHPPKMTGSWNALTTKNTISPQMSDIEDRSTSEREAAWLFIKCIISLFCTLLDSHKYQKTRRPNPTLNSSLYKTALSTRTRIASRVGFGLAARAARDARVVVSGFCEIRISYDNDIYLVLWCGQVLNMC